MPGSPIIDLVRVTWEAVPWAIPLVVASVVLAVVVGFSLQRTRGGYAWLVAALIVSAALVVALTLTPNAGVKESFLVDPRFDQGPWGYLRQPEFWLHLDSRSLNVALFIPLGLALGLTAWGNFRWVFLGIGIALPWAVEGLQLILPFARDAQAIDVADNTTGFLLGYASGLLIVSKTSVRRSRDPATPKA